MRNLKQRIEDLMSAVSFAEEGEFETARELLREERRVLLAVKKGAMDRKTLRYAMNTCKRLNASLDLLYVSSSEGRDTDLAQFISELQAEGLDYRLVKKGGCLKQAIIDYTTSKKEILFAVTESTENLDADCRGSSRKLSDAWRNLECPLVVVAESV
jgi:arginyl-tRNA synthetase